MKKVLIFDGTAVQTLAIHHQLVKLNCKVYVLSSSILGYGHFLNNAKTKKIPSLLISQDVKLKNFILEYIIKNDIEYIIPTNDKSSCLLVDFKEEFEKVSNFFLPERDIFYNGFDKYKLMDLCMRENIPVPETHSLRNFRTKTQFSFPYILKPNRDSGSRGFKIIDNDHSLQELSKLTQNQNNFHVQKFVKNQGRQIKAQLFIDKNGNLTNATVYDKKRFYPIKGGSSTYSETIKNNIVISNCFKVLHHLNWKGFADFDLIEDVDDGQFKIIEINPRFPACIKLSFNAGVNFVKNYIEACDNYELTQFEATSGAKLRFLALDLLSIFRSNGVKGLKMLFSEINTPLQDFYYTQPISFVIGTIGNIKKLFNKNFTVSKKVMNQNNY